jgi:signal transduction histidine kinase
VSEIDEIVERLAAHKLVGGAPREELRWLAAHSEPRRIEVGNPVFVEGTEMPGLFLLLAGRVSVSVDRGGALKKVMEWRGGEVTGTLPYSRAVKPPGPTLVEETTEALVLPREHFPALIKECHELTTIFVHDMLDRARRFTLSDFHEEKLQSLGRLSAGVAHELNNPASAITRSAGELRSSVAASDTAARALGALGLSQAQLATLEEIRTAHQVRSPVRRSPIEKSDREDVLGEWLQGHGLDDAEAEALADSALSIEDLDRLAGAIEPAALEIAIRYITASLATTALTTEIERAASRISGLVAAVKRSSYLDQGNAPKPVNVRQDLDDTLLLLNAKARKKGVSVTLDVAENVPAIEGFGGELNQVWMNLVDNALDAAPKGGHVRVSAARNRQCVIVRIVDDGPGIPRAIQGRIFDHFFTTKPLGEGTGLGLPIVQALVKRHNGAIEFQSEPGRTEFKVSLPTTLKTRDADAPPSGDSPA